MEKMVKVMEIVWLVIGIIGIGMTIYSIATHDNSGTVYFLIFTFTAGCMYAIRRRQRKRIARGDWGAINKNKNTNE